MTRAAEARRSNEEWVRALRGEGPDSSKVQEELHALVLRALRKATSLDEATLEDLTQIATLRVLEKLDRFEGRSRFVTWAWSVAVRAAFSELRKAQYRTTAPEAPDDTVEDEKADTTGPAERSEIVEALYRVIETELTPKQRAAILGELRGSSSEALSEELGTNRNALYKLLHDARARLRDGLASAGISDEEVRDAFGL